jgi:hypothetical protein
VEWDGHPCHVEAAVSRIVGLYDTDSEEDE